MDKSHNSPRLNAYQSSFSGSATTTTNGGFGYVGMPQTPRRDFGNGSSATEEEFKIRAKEFKKSQLKGKIIKKLVIFGVFLGIIILALGTVGLVLNHKYAGKALPYSYIGDISIGGLTAAEIKTALDLRAQETMVTFTEAGLTRQVPVNEFSPNFDTEKASKAAIVGFNPFNYLTKRNFSVPVSIEENQVDGYLQLNVADMQTTTLNAELIKSKEGILIKEERKGFRTSTAYVVEQLKKQLSTMQDPVISLSAAYEQPQITAEDLKDDLENANSMISTDVSLKVWNSKISPSKEDKIDWLDIRQVQGTNNIVIEFSQAKVREYVFGVASKYSFDKEDEVIAVDEAGSQYIKDGKNGQKVKNIDKIASDFYIALTTKQSGLFAFEFEYTDYAKIDRQSVNLIKAPVNTDEEGAAEIPPVTEDTTTQGSQTGGEVTVSTTPQNNGRSQR